MRSNALTRLAVHATTGLVLATTCLPAGATARLASARTSTHHVTTADARRVAMSLPIVAFELTSASSFRLVLATESGDIPVSVRDRGTFDGTTFLDIDIDGSRHVGRVFRDPATGAPAWSWDERKGSDVLRSNLADAWTEGMLDLLAELSGDIGSLLDDDSGITTHGVKEKLIFAIIGAIGTVVGIADDLGLIGGDDPPSDPVVVTNPGDDEGGVVVVGDGNTIIIINDGDGGSSTDEAEADDES